MEALTFQPFPKIARLRRNVVVTEKIDGTNASVTVLEDGTVLAGSRTRFITPTNDNYGFAKWVAAHEDELRTGLGVGQHFGEWWGQGIQRNYGLTEKRFSLFNTNRWEGVGIHRLLCCLVVPVLYTGVFDTEKIEGVLNSLRVIGSYAAPGFMNPEGIIVYHTASQTMFKQTLDRDDEPKGRVA
jgi:hypothetical protein